MKIYTNRKNEFGQTVLFGDLEIKFNHVGEADIKETVAAELVEKYKGWLTISKKEYVDVKIVETDNKIVEELQKSIFQLKEKVEARDSTIKVKEEEIKNWSKFGYHPKEGSFYSYHFELDNSERNNAKKVEEVRQINIEFSNLTRKIFNLSSEIFEKDIYPF